MDLLVSDKENKNVKASIIDSLSYIRKIIYSDEKDNSEITVNEIIILLKWLSTIAEGNKVYIRSLTITQNNLFTKLYRTFINSESREDTLQFLYFITNKSLEILDKYNDILKKCEEIKKITINQQVKNLIMALCESINGIIALKKTYNEDKMFSCFIDNLVENIILSKFLELKSYKFINIDYVDINNMLSKLKQEKETVLKVEENYINKKEEILKVEEPKEKEEPKKELKLSKEFKDELKEFQISQELKDFKKNDNDDCDYDNDVFDE